MENFVAVDPVLLDQSFSHSETSISFSLSSASSQGSITHPTTSSSLQFWSPGTSLCDYSSQGKFSSGSFYCHELHKAYPSPPHTSSLSKHTISLPEESSNDPQLHLFLVQDQTVQDLALVMHHEGSRCYRPLTPPPTLPHSMRTLPEETSDTDRYGEDVLQSTESCAAYDGDAELGEGSTASGFGDWGDMMQSSHMSPSWIPSQTLESTSTHSFLSPPRDNAGADLSNYFHLPLWPAHAIDSEQVMDVDLPFTDHHDNGLHFDHEFPLLSHPSVEEQSLSLAFHNPRPPLAPLDISFPSSTDECAAGDDASSSMSPASPTSLLSLTDTDEDLVTPNSPLILHRGLPEFDDDSPALLAPSSPSRRSCSILPDLDFPLEFETNTCAMPVSPTQSLISLPGADTDDELLPPISYPKPPFAVPSTPGQSLLFIDDPRDVPPPRSPSPDDFDLPISPDFVPDPEFSRLYELRKKCLVAERTARQAEAFYDNNDLASRAEARRIRKREKERSREVGALLRIKLGDVSSTSSNGGRKSSHDHGSVCSISQLVARMFFRRHEVTRPLARRRAASTSFNYLRSSLSRSDDSDSSGMDLDRAEC